MILAFILALSAFLMTMASLVMVERENFKRAAYFTVVAMNNYFGLVLLFVWTLNE